MQTMIAEPRTIGQQLTIARRERTYWQERARTADYAAIRPLAYEKAYAWQRRIDDIYAILECEVIA